MGKILASYDLLRIDYFQEGETHRIKFYKKSSY